MFPLHYLYSKVCEAKQDIISLILSKEGIDFLKSNNIPFDEKECDDGVTRIFLSSNLLKSRFCYT